MGRAWYRLKRCEWALGSTRTICGTLTSRCPSDGAAVLGLMARGASSLYNSDWPHRAPGLHIPDDRLLERALRWLDAQSLSSGLDRAKNRLHNWWSGNRHEDGCHSYGGRDQDELFEGKRALLYRAARYRGVKATADYFLFVPGTSLRVAVGRSPGGTRDDVVSDAVSDECFMVLGFFYRRMRASARSRSDALVRRPGVGDWVSSPAPTA